jgi:hypothetical protein
MKKVKYLTLAILIERRRLESMALRLGFLHPKVIRQSKKIDKLIYQAQKCLAS